MSLEQVANKLELLLWSFAGVSAFLFLTILSLKQYVDGIQRVDRDYFQKAIDDLRDELRRR